MLANVIIAAQPRQAYVDSPAAAAGMQASVAPGRHPPKADGQEMSFMKVWARLLGVIGMASSQAMPQKLDEKRRRALSANATNYCAPDAQQIRKLPATGARSGFHQARRDDRSV